MSRRTTFTFVGAVLVAALVILDGVLLSSRMNQRVVYHASNLTTLESFKLVNPLPPPTTYKFYQFVIQQPGTRQVILRIDANGRWHPDYRRKFRLLERKYRERSVCCTGDVREGRSRVGH